MKGGDRAYTRGPSLGWLFAKCCCCLPCRGEWLCAFATSSSNARAGGVRGRGGGGWGMGWEGGRGGSLGPAFASVSLAESGLARGELLTWMQSCSLASQLLTWQRLWMSGRQPAGGGGLCRGAAPPPPAAVCPCSGRLAPPCSHLRMDLS